MDLKEISIRRKKVQMLCRKRKGLERIAMGREPMVAASFMPRRLRPGGLEVYYLSASIQGSSRHRYVRKAEVRYWRKRALSWRAFMKAIASWVKLNREIGRLRCEPLPGGRQG